MKDFLIKKYNFYQNMALERLKRLSEINILTLYLLVGVLGFSTNMSILTLALYLGVPTKLALILGIVTSMSVLFVLDRQLVFSYANGRPLTPQVVGFMLVCLLGGMLNYFCTLSILLIWPGLYIQIAECAGVLAGTIFNYVFLRFAVFSR